MTIRQGSARLVYMDNLRALAMLAGLFFHAALAFSPMANGFWLSADQQNHWLFDVFAWFSHLFRMPVFFVMAGFFCALLLNKAGPGQFAKNRLIRVVLPLVLFLTFAHLAMQQVIAFALVHVQHQSPLLALIETMLASPEPPVMPMSTLHLWFLYHLLFLYLLTYAAHILLSANLISWFSSLKPGRFILLLIVAILPALYAVPAPFPAPEWIFPALWALWFYGVFFALGYGFYAVPGLIEQFELRLPYYLGIGLLSYALYYTLLPVGVLPEQAIHGLHKLLVTALEAICCVLLTISAILYAKRYLNSNSQLMRYLSKVSYWVYIVHLPLLFFIQFLLMDLSWHMSLKFIVSCVATLVISMVSFHVLVSRTYLARLLVSKSA